MVLVFVGVKMMIVDLYHIPVAVSLAVVVGVITGSVLLSLRKPRGLPPLTQGLEPAPESVPIVEPGTTGR